MNNGWIKIHRKISDKGWYKHSDYVHLWMHLLIKASHCEMEFFSKGQTVILKPGQFITGRQVLNKETGIHESKIERILNVFEKEKQIEQQKSNIGRLISILSWDKYQISEQQMNNGWTTDEQRMNNERTTDEQPVNTYKNVKNTKNVNNVKNEKKENNTLFVETSSTDERWQLWVESWFNFYTLKVGIKPNFSGAEAKGLKNIRKYLSENCPGENSPDENGLTAWNQILDNWQCQDQWMITQLELKIISSKINNVLVNIKKHSDAKQFKSAPINDRSNTAKELDEYFAKRYPKQQPNAG
jgi:hypothetical protein